MKHKYPVINASVEVTARSVTATGHVYAIDWFFPEVKKGEHPAIYVGRVAKFMRQWYGLTMRQAGEKFKISNISLFRIEHGKWSSIRKTNAYLFRAYGLTMDINLVEKKKSTSK